MLVLVAQLVVVGAAAFLLGSVNPATIVARLLGRDLRHEGSGNPGATNAGRVLGRRWGVLVLVLDLLKAYLPTVLVLSSMGRLAALVTGLAVVLGHVFSPFLGGRGGKGVACAAGAVLAVAPLLGAAAAGVFVVGFAAGRVVGEASVIAALALVAAGAAATAGVLPGTDRTVGVWLVLLGVVVLSRHDRNLRAWWRRVRG